MSSFDSADESTLSLDQVQQIDALCDEFENALRIGTNDSLQVEDFVDRVPHDLRIAALVELIPIEMGWKRRRNLPVDLDEYRTRFPELGSHLSQWFQHSSNESQYVPIEPGVHLGKYEIVELLGAGGMGQVYAAVDTGLNRKVAIKVLLPRYQRIREALNRIEIEARALASMKHPNILAVYDFDRQNDVTFMVLELLEGETLATRLRRETPSNDESLSVALQIASGLAAAHERDIVHRDLKPQNIFLSGDGTAKILDFGLARLLGSTVDETASDSDGAPATADTVHGARLGTPGYMSPEQLQGQVVDARSDVFSFGCVLYEMLFSKPAFKQPSMRETDAATLHQPLLPANDSRDHLQSALFGVVERCVHKDPVKRHASGGDVYRHLLQVKQDDFRRRGRRSRIARRALFVGMCLAVLLLGGWIWWEHRESVRRSKTMSQLHELIVGISTTSAALELEPLKRMVREVNHLGDELQMPFATMTAMVRGAIDSTTQYEYVMGYLRLEQGTQPDILQAIDHFQRASNNDPTFAPAYIGLGECYYRLSNAYASPKETMPRVQEFAGKALELDSRLAAAHVLLALYEHRFNWNWNAAEVHFRDALGCEDDLTMAHHMYGNSLALRERFDEAITHLEAALALDPQSTQLRTDRALIDLYRGDFETAERTLQTILRESPDFFAAQWALGEVFLHRRDLARAAQELQRASELDDSPEVQAELAYCFGRSPIATDNAQARQIVGDLEVAGNRRYVPSVAVAIANLGINEVDKAVQSLVSAEAEQDEWLLWLEVDVVFDELRGIPEFEAIRERVLADTP